MLFSNGNDLIRIQCAFVDTPEVEEITNFIGNQQGYPDALILPEFVGDSEGSQATLRTMKIEMPCLKTLPVLSLCISKDQLHYCNVNLN